MGVTLVQSAYTYNSSVTLPAAPLAGNTLLLYIAGRNSSAPTPPGFTLVARVTASESFTRHGAMFYRTVQAGDGQTWGDGNIDMHSITEWAGSYAGIANSQSQVGATTDITCGGAVTPTAGTSCVLVGGATVGTDDGHGTATVSPATGVVELVDTSSPPDMPSIWNAYRQVNSAAGPYYVRGTASLSKLFCGVTVVILGQGAAPGGLSGAPEYVVEMYDSSATFGPNNKIAEIWDALAVGWSRFDRIPGKAFFSLPQSSPNLAAIVPLLTHIAIWRVTPTGDTLVYRGAVIDTDNTGDDVIVNAFDYISLLSLSRAGYRTLYPTKLLGSELVSPEWLLARNATSSILGFVTTGTIEDPIAADEVTAIRTNAQFGTLDQSRLQLLYDISEMGRANTTHQVTFEIDLTNTFNFWKNQSGVASVAFVLGGNISDYQYGPGWARYRNDIATIGTAAAGGAAEITSVNAGEVTAKGRRQDVTTLKTLLGVAGGAPETDQQKAALDRALKNLVQQQASLSLRVERGKVEPFVGFAINDLVPIEISNGVDLITGNRRIIGLRTVFSEPGEDIEVVVAPVLT